jgi:hypothetical protein
MTRVSRDIPDTQPNCGSIEDPIAQYKLGKRHEEDIEESLALHWYRLSADQGYAAAQHSLAQILAGIAIFSDDDETLERELEQIDLYNSAAVKQHYLPAIYALAESYRKGEWYKRSIDTELAIEYHRLAAQSGFSHSHYALGIIFLERDESQGDADFAVMSLIKAANFGLQLAQKKLASVFAGGHPRIPQNVSMAREWLRLAEENKDSTLKAEYCG